MDGGIDVDGVDGAGGKYLKVRADGSNTIMAGWCW